MSIDTISYSKTGYFTKLICDYLDEAEEIQPFYNRFPKIGQFDAQIKEKTDTFHTSSRELLVKSLKDQYRNFSTSDATKQHIEALLDKKTFTVTTGHQLNLFTGPLYFLYKIFSVINLAETLRKQHKGNQFVPVYWMATEDHDFDEINYFNFSEKKLQWDRKPGGAVGELSTEGLDAVFRQFEQELGSGSSAIELIALFKTAYFNHDNLASATRYLANTLFQDYGLVIIDGNTPSLKEVFIPYAARELTDQLSFKEITATTKRLTDLGYNEQVHPREINLFYLTETARERIIEKEGIFYVNNSELSFSKEAILAELENHPERFSPNALLRPLYQEVILPNLCYVGGGGELAYWFQLKDYFNKVGVPFPMLLLRNSVLLLTEKLSEKLNKLNVTVEELFLSQSALLSLYTQRISEIEIDFSEQRTHLRKQFEGLYELAKQTDASFVGAVAAQEKKQLNGLDKLEKRLLKAQKRKHKDVLERLTAIQDELFPGGSLQERTKNFSEFYMNQGDQLLSRLKNQLDPLVNKFTVLRW